MTFTATVSSSSVTPAGTVKFKNGSATLRTETLAGGMASLTTTTLGAGTKSMPSDVRMSTRGGRPWLGSEVTPRIKPSKSSTRQTKRTLESCNGCTDLLFRMGHSLQVTNDHSTLAYCF